MDYDSATERRDCGSTGDFGRYGHEETFGLKTRRGVLVLILGRLEKAEKALFDTRMILVARNVVTHVSQHMVNVVSCTRLATVLGILHHIIISFSDD